MGCGRIYSELDRLEIHGNRLESADELVEASLAKRLQMSVKEAATDLVLHKSFNQRIIPRILE